MSVQPLSPARLAAALDTTGLPYQRGPAGEFVVSDKHLFLVLEGDTEGKLQLRGMWRAVIEQDEDFSQAAAMVLDCCAHRHGPKAYLLETEAGHRLGAECAAYSASGFSTEQLENFVQTSLAMVAGFLQEAQGALPHLTPGGGEEPANKGESK